MRDIIITVKRQKRELWVLLISFVLANLVNLVGIIRYESPAVELITSLHIVLLLTLVIYAIILILRLLTGGIFCLFRGRRKS